jgi:hypothetical protein
MVIIVPFVAAFTLSAISFLMMILNAVASVSGMNDVPRVLFSLTLSRLIQRRRYTSGHVLTRALAMVRVWSLPPPSLVMRWVFHCSSMKHCIEALDLCAYLLVILMKKRSELIDCDPGGQSIVCSHAVNLLSLPLDLIESFVEHLRPILESFLVDRKLLVKLGVVPLGGGAILSFILGRPRVILPTSVSLTSCPVSLSS